MYNLDMSPKFPLVIAIAGGSGSGKTTVANVILEKVGADRIAYLPHDAYYRDLTNLPLPQRMQINFDHPDSLETDLLVQHVQMLNHGGLWICPCMISLIIDERTRRSALTQKGDHCGGNPDPGGATIAGIV